MNKLPPELIDAIGSHFDYSDWCALRLTCKIFYQLSSSHFASRYFRRVSVILTQEALTALEAFTLQEPFRNVVEELSLIPQVFGDYEVDLSAFEIILRFCAPGSENWSTEEVQRQYMIYQAAQTDHLAFAESECLVESLTRCLNRLRNVSTIGLRPYPPSWPGKEKSRFICLGMRALRKRLPFDPCARLLMPSACRFADRPLSTWGLVWNMWNDIRHPVWTKGLTSLLKAMCAASPPLEVQRLYTCLVEDELSVPPDCFTLSEPLYQSLGCVLRKLQNLDICLRRSNPNDTTEFLSSLVIRAAPNLHVLRLTLWDQFHDLSPDHFDNLAQQVNFTRLTELHLHWIELTQPSFQLFLSTAAPTLQVLTLVAVSLNDPIPVAMGPSRRFRAAISTVWRRFMNTLRDTIPSIRYFKMRALAYRQNRFEMIDPSERELMTMGHCLRGQHSKTHFYEINTKMSFVEWIDRMELCGRPLRRPLPKHRGKLITRVTSRLMSITNFHNLHDRASQRQNYISGPRGEISVGTLTCMDNLYSLRGRDDWEASLKIQWGKFSTHNRMG
ncbi:hypothetical protein ASPTUDRAFT_40581 [Aspergillus tubingensis CBS 134.48]|uniref:F-box domain-containing protein n=1 Tax=Aspergillus tubingensis (strain CBS 134.48) TaxID=767770 RepID=A0A1L9NDN4_ASPTC|nr:hypothetical protein ASPTUDRAFT_40581 [Aspergillus tubingensis CBS 134.48]